MESNRKLQRAQLAHRRQHRKKRRQATILGACILILAVIGIIFLLFNIGKSGYHYIKTIIGPSETAEYFEQYLEPVVAEDPQPFTDIAKADSGWMLKTAIWAAINGEKDSGRYGYTDDNREIVPKADILKYFEKFFGDRVSPNLHSFDDNGINYEYNQKNEVFYIPIMAKSNIFTPNVTKITKRNDSIYLTVQYLPSNGWTQTSNGTIKPPAASKTMIYTLKGSRGSYAITAVGNAAGSASSAASASPSNAT